jgi:gas vesicle protein
MYGYFIREVISMPRKSGSSIGVLIAGALAGVVGALLLAPKAGKDTRDLVRRKGSEYINIVREKLQRRKTDTDHQEPRR